MCGGCVGMWWYLVDTVMQVVMRCGNVVMVCLWVRWVGEMNDEMGG